MAGTGDWTLTAPTTMHTGCVDDGVEFGEEYFRRLCSMLRSDNAEESTKQIDEMLENCTSLYASRSWEESPSYRSAVSHAVTMATDPTTQRPSSMLPIHHARPTGDDATVAKRIKLQAAIDDKVQCCACNSTKTADASNLMCGPCGICGRSYHQRCHQPPIAAVDARDPLYVLNCAACTAKSTPTTPRGSAATTPTSGIARPIGRASLTSTEKTCAKCSTDGTESGNELIACAKCASLYHQQCHRPPVGDDQLAKTSFSFTCTPCQTRRFSALKTAGKTSDVKSWKDKAAAHAAKQKAGTSYAEASANDSRQAHRSAKTEAKPTSSAVQIGEKIVAKIRKQNKNRGARF